jgi:hypothetical protein
VAQSSQPPAPASPAGLHRRVAADRSRMWRLGSKIILMISFGLMRLQDFKRASSLCGRDIRDVRRIGCEPDSRRKNRGCSRVTYCSFHGSRSRSRQREGCCINRARVHYRTETCAHCSIGNHIGCAISGKCGDYPRKCWIGCLFSATTTLQERLIQKPVTIFYES